MNSWSSCRRNIVPVRQERRIQRQLQSQEYHVVDDQFDVGGHLRGHEWEMGGEAAVENVHARGRRLGGRNCEPPADAGGSNLAGRHRAVALSTDVSVPSTWTERAKGECRINFLHTVPLAEATSRPITLTWVDAKGVRRTVHTEVETVLRDIKARKREAQRLSAQDLFSSVPPLASF